MNDEDSFAVGDVLESVITNTVSREEETSANTHSSSSPYSLDYGDDTPGESNDNHVEEKQTNGLVEAVNGKNGLDGHDGIDAIGDDSNEETEYVIEKVVEKRIEPDGRVYYRVKWQNYPSSSNTWESAENLVDCDKSVELFEIRCAERLAERHASEEDEQIQTNGTISNRRRPRTQSKEFEINDIMGITTVGNEKYFLVSLSNSTQKTFIRASLANRIVPQKVIDFYIKSIRWKSS